MKISTSSITGAMLATLALGNSPAAAADLTISYYGGKTAEQFRNNIVAPFEEANGVEIAMDTGRSTERLSKLIATKGRGVDVVFLSDYQIYEAQKRGVIAEIAPGDLPNRANLRAFAQDPLDGNSCPAFVVLGTGLAYNTDIYPDGPPTSWNELLNEDLSVKAGYPDIGISSAIPLAIKMAELNGGDIENVAPGFEAIKSARDNLQFFAGSEVRDSIVSGEVALAPQLNIFIRKEEGVPIGFTFPQDDGGLGILNLICPVVGSKNPELALKFINHIISDEVQYDILNVQGETPVSANVDLSNMDQIPRYLVSEEDMAKMNFWSAEAVTNAKPGIVELWQESVVAN